MIFLGIVLLIIGFIVFPPLVYIGIILIVIGVIFFALGSAGREIGGRRHWY
jgi:hypothetical protein